MEALEVRRLVLAVLDGLKPAVAVNAALVLLGVLTSVLFLHGARPNAR